MPTRKTGSKPSQADKLPNVPGPPEPPPSGNSKDRCPCGGELLRGTWGVVEEEGETTLVVKNVPAAVCKACGKTQMEPQVEETIGHMLDAVAEGETVVRSYD